MMRLKHLVQGKKACLTSTQDDHKDVPVKDKKGKVARLSKLITRTAKKLRPYSCRSKEDIMLRVAGSSGVQSNTGVDTSQLAREGEYTTHEQPSCNTTSGSSDQDVLNTPRCSNTTELEENLEGNGDGPPTQGNPLTLEICRIEGISTRDWAYEPSQPIAVKSDNMTSEALALSVMDPSSLTEHASIQSMSIEQRAPTEDEPTDDRAESPQTNTSDTSLVFSESASRPEDWRAVSNATTLFASSIGSTQTVTLREVSKLAVDSALEANKQAEETEITVFLGTPTETISAPVKGQEGKPQAHEEPDVPTEDEVDIAPEDEASVISEEEADLAPKEDTTDVGSTTNDVDHAVFQNNQVWEAAFTSRGYSHINEIEDLKDDHADELKHQKADLEAQYAKELAQLRGDLEARHTWELANVREEIKAATKALQEQSGFEQAQNPIEVLYNELQELHARTVRNLEGQEEITQAKDQEVLQLRKRIYDATNDFNQVKHQLHADNAKLKKELGLLQLTLGRNKILFDETSNKLAQFNEVLEDDPRFRNIDQEQLLNLREKQLADTTDQLHETSDAFQELEYESKRKGREAEDRVANLERSLELKTEKCDFLSERNNYLEDYGEDVFGRVQKRMDKGEALAFLHDRLAVLVLDNSRCTERVKTLEKELQQSNVEVRLGKEQHRELSEKCSNNEKVLGKLKEENRALVGKTDSQGFSIDGKEKEVKDLTEALAHGAAWRDREIERLSNLFDTLGRSDSSYQTRWALERKDSIIKRLDEDLQVTKSQLGQLQEKLAEAEWSAGNDQELAGYSDYVDEKRRERLEDAEAELEELRIVAPGYNFRHRQEAVLYKEQLKASEENANKLKEKLEKLQETYNSFLENVKIHVSNIRGKAAQSEHQLRARNEKLENLGHRVYTQMIRFEASLPATNKVVAGDTWDTLVAECMELFADSKDKLENDMYDADGFLRELPEENNHDDQSGLIPRPLFSQENTPEPQDANADEGRKSKPEGASNRQDKPASDNRAEYAEPATIKHLEQEPSSFASNAATVGSSSLELPHFLYHDKENPGEGTVSGKPPNITAVRRLGNNDDTVRPAATYTDDRVLVNEGQAAKEHEGGSVSPVPHYDGIAAMEYQKVADNRPSKASTDKKDGAAISNPDDDSYNLSEEELKLLNDTGRFPDRFALPSMHIEEQERFLYDGSDDEAEEDGEGSSQGDNNQDRDKPDEDEQEKVQDEVGNTLFHFAVKSGAARGTNARDEINFTAASNYAQGKDDKDVFTFAAKPSSPPDKDAKGMFHFTAAPASSLGNGNQEIFSFTGDSNSPLTNNGKGVFDFTASSSLLQERTLPSADNKSPPTVPKLGFLSSGFPSMYGTKHGLVKNDMDEDPDNNGDSDTGTIVADTPPTDMDSPPVQSTSGLSNAAKADDQAGTVDTEHTPVRIPISTIKGLHHEDTAIPLPASNNDLDLSVVRDGQKIPISYTLPTVEGDKGDKPKAEKKTTTVTLKVGGRRIYRKKRLW